jgi:hypothetical protein
MIVWTPFGYRIDPLRLRLMQFLLSVRPVQVVRWDVRRWLVQFWREPGSIRGIVRREMYRALDPAEAARLAPYVDKVAVKQYAAARLGAGAVTPDLLVTRDAAEMVAFLRTIDMTVVVKPSHGSGAALFVGPERPPFGEDLDRVLARRIPPRAWRSGVASLGVKDLDDPRVERLLAHWLGATYGVRWKVHPELPDTLVPPALLCEPFLGDPTVPPRSDIKIHCVAGEPLLIQIDAGRYADFCHTTLDANWVPLQASLGRSVCSEDRRPALPDEATRRRLLEDARALAAPFRFVRVDLYDVDGATRFGELTFGPSGGRWHMKPRREEPRFVAEANQRLRERDGRPRGAVRS